MRGPSRGTLLTGIAALVTVPICSRAAEAATVRISAQVTDVTAEHLYATDLGLFRSAGLNAEISPLRNSGALVAALAGGSVDLISSTIVSVAVARSKGIDLRVIAPSAIYTGVPQSAIVVAPNSPIRSGADLNEKTVSVNGLGDLSEVSLASWIDATGGDYKSVKVTELAFPSIAAALAQGRIDAALSVEPFTSLFGSNVKIIGDPETTIGKEWMITGWYAMADWLSANRETARRFVNVMLQTAKWANGHHDQSAAILAKYLNISPDAVKNSSRAVYGEQPLVPAMIQPVLDHATKYIGLQKTAAASLIWKP